MPFTFPSDDPWDSNETAPCLLGPNVSVCHSVGMFYLLPITGNVIQAFLRKEVLIDHKATTVR